MAATPAEALSALQQLEQDGDLKKRLTIVRISEPISTDVGSSYASPSRRGSDISTSNLENPTPSSLEADLSHYKVGGIEALRAGKHVLTFCLGAIFQASILLRRASHERKVSALNCGRPTSDRGTQ